MTTDHPFQFVIGIIVGAILANLLMAWLTRDRHGK